MTTSSYLKYLHMYVHANTHIHMHTDRQTDRHTHIWTQTHRYKHACTRTHAHIHTYIHTYRHTMLFTLIVCSLIAGRVSENPMDTCGKICSLTVDGWRCSTNWSSCCSRFTLVARSVDENSLTTHGTILRWYSSVSNNFPNCNRIHKNSNRTFSLL